MGSYLYFRASGRRFGLVAVVFLLASIFCVALSQVLFRFCVSVLLIVIGLWFAVEVFCKSVDGIEQGETNGSVLDLGRRSKVITPLSFCSSFHFVSVRSV